MNIGKICLTYDGVSDRLKIMKPQIGYDKEKKCFTKILNGKESPISIEEADVAWYDFGSHDWTVRAYDKMVKRVFGLG